MNLRKHKFFWILYILLFIPSIKAQENFNFDTESIKERLTKDVYILAHDTMMGRRAGTKHEIAARDYIIAQFKEANLMPILSDSIYYHAFRANTQISHNIYGLLNNNAPQTVVIGAHYDHIGYTYSKETPISSDYIYNGADDNASGTAILIELARYLSAQNNLKYNYLFIAFSSEEQGLIGSKFFMTNFISDEFDMAYMINLDMVGRLGAYKNKLIVFGTGTSKIWRPVLKEVKHKSLKMKKVKYAPAFSDHAYFYKNNIPYLYFTTGLHPDYHKVTDISELINFEGMVLSTKRIKDIITEIEKHEHIPFKKVNGFRVFTGTLFAILMML